MADSHRRADLGVDCLVHDLNNVFQTVLEAADLIGSDPNWTSVAAMIIRGVEQGRRIVAGILETERAVALDGLLDGAVQFAQDFVAAIGGPTLRFARNVEPNLCLNLKASALERALMNLFINSAQAARAAGRSACEIRVCASLDADEMELIVADDGPGIPADILPLIFASGFSTKPRSSGLGLHIVDSVVRANGGSVSVHNAETGGAVFTIRLPAERDAVASQRGAAALSAS